MPSLTARFSSLLNDVRRPGHFYVAGTTTFLPPSLTVTGVGPVALPLLPAQVKRLIALAEAAPFGRGQRTIVDKAVRRGWQIGASRIQLSGRHWPEVLKTILARVAQGFDISGPIEAELYKLLIYDRGSFFVSHRDTEKAPGMIATLVIVLPSPFAGGELVVRHKNREARLDLQCDDPAETTFAAFYADCVHEVLPVTDGCRLALTYNLIRRRAGRRIVVPDYADQEAHLTAALQPWRKSALRSARSAPTKLVYPLEHAYTQAELGFANLKGRDAAVAGVVAAAARRAECDLHTALLTIEESGAAECTAYFGYGSRRGRWHNDDDDEEDENEFEAGEVYDRSVYLSDWHAIHGSSVIPGSIPVDQDEISPPAACDDLTPDEEHFHEATGNEGASFERTYRRAALVLWPRENLFAVLSQAGLLVTLPYLRTLLRRWEKEGRDTHSALRAQAKSLAGHMLAQWPRERWNRHDEKTQSNEAGMLTLLTRLKEESLIERFLTEVIAAGNYEKADNAALIAALKRLPRTQRVLMIERITEGTADRRFSACADLLARGATARTTPSPLDLATAASRLVEKLPGEAESGAQFSASTRKDDISPDFIADTLIGLCAIDAMLAERAVRHFLAFPKRYDLDAILTPALRKAQKERAVKQSVALECLRVVCLDHLRARIAEPLEPPPDWRRTSVVPCPCAHCAELARYLDDPGRREWTYKAAEAKRSHVEDTIKRAHADIDVKTERRGSPYSLICAKNQASYEQRVRQRKSDIQNARAIVGGGDIAVAIGEQQASPSSKTAELTRSR